MNEKTRTQRYILFLPIIIVVWFILHTLYIICDGLNDEIANVDVAVVLGNTVEKNGQPSNRLKARLDKAVELYHRKIFPKIIVSGGLGVEGYEEVEVMRDYLIQHQIQENDIFLDKYGYNTHKTAINAKQIMQAQDMKSVMIISQYFHITRTRLAFQKAGLTAIYSAHANYFELRDFYSIVREFVGFYSYVLNPGS